MLVSTTVSYCQYCESLGFLHKLGPRIYPNDQPISYDSDKWLQGYNCGEITPRVHDKQDNEIGPIVEPPKNIHKHNNVTVLATNSSKKRRAMIDKLKKNRIGYNRQNNYTDIDLDLRYLLQKGKQLVSYQSTNDTFEG